MHSLKTTRMRMHTVKPVLVGQRSKHATPCHFDTILWPMKRSLKLSRSFLDEKPPAKVAASASWKQSAPQAGCRRDLRLVSRATLYGNPWEAAQARACDAVQTTNIHLVKLRHKVHMLCKAEVVLLPQMKATACQPLREHLTPTRCRQVFQHAQHRRRRRATGPEGPEGWQR